MSTELDIFSQQTNLVQQASARGIDDFTKSVNAASSTSKRISIRGGVFRLMVNGKELDQSDLRHMDVVIVNVSPAVHRTFYAAGYDAKTKASPPVCWSSDSTSPDASVTDPQARSCAECPQNVKGSGPNGTRSCRYSRRIAVVRAEDLEGDVYQVTLPAQSIFGSGTPDKRPLHEYAEYVKAQGYGLLSVITRMSFDTNSATPRLGFKAVGILDDEQYNTCSEKSKSEDSTRAVTLTVSSNREEGESSGDVFQQPATRPAQAAAAPKPSPQAEVIDVEEVEEPVKRSAAKKPAVEPAPAKVDMPDASLDDLLADWA
jgi:hypothetical protein